ncbi:flavoprotein [Paenibacillus antibioticophila]|uniref:Flavoprotein n=1 Tax=Paenibacillus antibioticophila TaxID=1274374 RepID=A0A920CG50_9BACL|nr:NAD(P)/FAD-dependent oxidoreductase [Paenibacillus antibioticophila]GIO38951.1 flavoprotein [Paenibacillus antibioticophila]
MYDYQDSVHHTLIIIGAGASGLMAAVTARDLGIDTAILEGNDRIGKKISMTGDGRCNITNDSTTTGTDDAGVALARKYYGNQPEFPRSVLQQFGIRQTIDFFHVLGLPLTSLKEGFMYPMSMQAASVVDIFELALEERSIPVYLNRKVLDVTVSADHPRFKMICRTETEEQVVYTSDYLFLCTGGLTGQNAGTDGSGYTLAQKMGHSLVKPVPAIVQLKVKYPYQKSLSGIKLQGRAYILVNGKIVRSETGEIHFTDYGFSGPPVLQLGRKAAVHLAKGDSVTVQIDLMPNRTEEEVIEFLETNWATFAHRTVAESFTGFLHKKLTSVLLKEAKIDQEPDLLCQELSWKTKKIFYKLLKCWEFKVTETQSFELAQATAGGIATKELDANTLESRLVPGLYLAGEVMDVDGDFGGYNLQWAWSSGYTAAMALGKHIFR